MENHGPSVDDREPLTSPPGWVRTGPSREVRGRLVRLAYRFLWNRSDAEDVVQDALATAQARANELRDERKWWSWICRIVVHRCHHQARQRQRHARHSDELRAFVARSADERRVEPDADERALVRMLLGELPTRQREVTVLRHLEGMAYEQIAEVLGISASTARVQGRNGLETLRGWLLKRNPDGFGKGPASGSEST